MLTITPKELKDAVGRVKTACEPKSAVPVFGAIRFYVADDASESFLEASTHEQACRRQVENLAMNMGALDVLVHAGHVDKVMKVFAKANEVTVRASDDGKTAVFSAGSRKMEAPTEIRDEYLEARFRRGMWLLEGSAKEIHDRLVRALAFASKDQTRPHLTTVALDLHPKDGAAFVATDSYRLCVLPAPGDALVPDEHEVHAIDGFGVAKVARSLKGADTYELYMPADDRWYVHVIDGGRELWQTRKTDGRYPNWRQLIPDEDMFSVDLTMPKAELASAVEAAKVIAVRNEPMRLVVNGDVRVTVKQPDAPQFEETIDGASVAYMNAEARTDHLGDGQEYGYNPDFLADCTKMIGTGDQIRARMITPLRPCLLMADGDRALLMPIRLNV